VGLIAGLDCGWPVEDALRLAGTVSALVAQGRGTLGALPRFDAGEQLVRSGVRPRITP
jgi:sugar/nucleoside kinase (ribokinase family)